MINPEYEVCQELQVMSLQIWVIICEPITALIQKGVLLPDTVAMELAMLLWAGSTGVIGIWSSVEQQSATPGMQQMEAQIPLLYQMNHLNFEQMLHRLWDSIIDSYLNKQHQESR
jgi:bifunctional DNase/RNase